MATVNIPDEVRAAGYAAFSEAVEGGYEVPQIYGQTLAVVAPLIIAAELARLADTFARNAQACRSLGFTDFSEGRGDGLTVASEALRRRASELRGEASNG